MIKDESCSEKDWKDGALPVTRRLKTLCIFVYYHKLTIFLGSYKAIPFYTDRTGFRYVHHSGNNEDKRVVLG